MNDLRIKNLIAEITGISHGDFDPINNPQDAWPIILENNIAIAPPVRNEKGWLAWTVVNEGVEVFKARNDNPLRAAMIVFLKKKNILD